MDYLNAPKMFMIRLDLLEGGKGGRGETGQSEEWRGLGANLQEFVSFFAIGGHRVEMKGICCWERSEWSVSQSVISCPSQRYLLSFRKT